MALVLLCFVNNATFSCSFLFNCFAVAPDFANGVLNEVFQTGKFHSTVEFPLHFVMQSAIRLLLLSVRASAEESKLPSAVSLLFLFWLMITI